MQTLPTPRSLEILAAAAGITMAEACRRAEITPAVFTRWKTGNSSPSIGNVEKLQIVLAAAVEDAAG